MKSRWLILLLALFCVAAAKKQPPFSIRFHQETSEKDTSTFAFEAQLKYPPRKAHFSKVPILSEQNVVAIFPFTAADGSRGCALQLDDLGRINLEALTMEKRGSSLLVRVNGRQIVDMLIDKRVSDGIISIPFGLTDTDIAMASKKFPVMGRGKQQQ